MISPQLQHNVQDLDPEDPYDSAFDTGPDERKEEDEIQRDFDSDVKAAVELTRWFDGEMKRLTRDPRRTSEKPEEALIDKLQEDYQLRQVDFVDDCYARWDRLITSKGRNILHVLAYLDRETASSARWLIEKAITRFPKHMGIMDAKKRTPLAVALSEDQKNGTFVSAFSCVDRKVREEVGQALAMEVKRQQAKDDGRTILYNAIKMRLKAKYVIPIIEVVPEDMFTMRHDGLTPLHLAVEYKRSDESQVEIVAALIERGPGALDRIKGPGQSQKVQTVYQYYESTRPSSVNTPSTFPKETNVQAREKEPKNPDAKKDRPEAPKLEKLNPLNKAPDRGFLGASGGNIGKRRESASSSGNPISLPTDNMTRDVRRAQSALQANTSRALKSRRPIAVSEEERAKSAERIRELLKLAYLRNMRPNEAAKCLHIEKQPNKELWFDYGPEPKSFGKSPKLSIKKADFEDQFRHLKFHDILQYVAFPRLEVDGRGNTDLQCQGRNDMQYLFQWLRAKGVNRIIRVEIDDMEMPCHSDEAVEETLKDLQVEVLDWRKPDLCPVLLSSISRNLRKLTLYWSGKNAVLRSWSESDGLAAASSLEVIELVQTEGLDTLERTKNYLESFKIRLNKSWEARNKTKPPDVTWSTLHSSRKQPQSAPSMTVASLKPPQAVDPSKWLPCMVDFAEEFGEIDGINDTQNDPNLNPVKVCLIDDGMDINHPELSDKMFPGKSFDDYRDGWNVSPYFVSAKGHGTLMARLINRICPSAVIYVIKLRTIKTLSSEPQIDPQSAIEAIEHATEQGAQIISMSWACEMPGNRDDKERFDEVIKKAASKGVLMFCSARDEGRSSDHGYPHASNPQSSFLIGAAKHSGAKADYVTDDRTINFLLPGDKVVLRSLHPNKGSDELASHRGSSVATALASGLAALVIECVRLGLLYEKQRDRTHESGPSYNIYPEDLEKIREKSNMDYALSFMGAKIYYDKLRYIEVWETFPNVTEQLRDGLRDKLEVVASLASGFLRKSVMG